MRRDLQRSITRRGRCEAGDDSMEPVTNGAEGVVIERRHWAGIEWPVWEEAVPPLPDRRRSHRDRIQPGRAFTLEEEPIGEPELPDAAQGIAEDGCTEEAGADPVTVLTDEIREPSPDACALACIGEQVELQG